MENFSKYIFPILLIMSSVYLAIKEIVSYRFSVKTSKETKKLKSKLVRRLTGSVLAFTIGFMIYYGMANFPAPTKEIYQGQINYWFGVFGLVFLAVMLALWDVFESVRSIGRMVDESTKEQMEEIQETLRKSKSDKNKQVNNKSERKQAP